MKPNYSSAYLGLIRW